MRAKEFVNIYSSTLKLKFCKSAKQHKSEVPSGSGEGRVPLLSLQE